jgi:D-alanyl-D-alanine carboxypeptidase (penicillin-binding protein 5/6)
MEEVKKTKGRRHYWLGVILLLIIGYVIWVFQFSYPSLAPTYVVPSFSADSTAKTLPFPAYGQSAIGINGFGVIASSGKQTPAPMASVAKLITALCVLEKYPITNPASSPVVTLSQSDVNIYNSYLAAGGSVVRVVAGEQISEYQMLQTMLLPSANNMADSLAIWAFGSLSSYATYANAYLVSHNLSDTHVGTDASGFDPSTTSTSGDLIKLAQIVITNSTLSQIVSMKNATGLPVVGTINNVNSLLGLSNIDGIKTGNTSQAGGVYVSSSVVTINHDTYVITTSLMGAPTLWQALNDSYKLIKAAQANFVIPDGLNKIQKGTLIGQYSVPWSKTKIEATATSSLPVDVWGGNQVRVNVLLNSVSDKSKSGDNSGTISAYDTRFSSHGTTKIILNNSVPQPSRWWLLLHPLVSLR